MLSKFKYYLSVPDNQYYLFTTFTRYLYKYDKRRDHFYCRVIPVHSETVKLYQWNVLEWMRDIPLNKGFYKNVEKLKTRIFDEQDEIELVYSDILYYFTI